MSPPGRYHWLLAAAVFVAGCDATVQQDLSERQANEVVVALHGQGIGASKESSGGPADGASFAVRVPVSDVPRALSVLHAVGLPRVDPAGLAEVFGEGSLVPTPTEERARYVAAVSGELSRSLTTMEGVRSARVHLALPPRVGLALDAEAPQARASVLITRQGGGRAPPEHAIRALVAGAVQGLEASKVAVIMTDASPLPPASPALTPVGPFPVAAGSALPLRLTLGAMLALNLLLAAAVIWLVRRKRSPATA